MFVSWLDRGVSCVALDDSHLCGDVQVQLSYFLLLCVCLCYGALMWFRISTQISQIHQRVCKLLCVLSVMFLL